MRHFLLHWSPAKGTDDRGMDYLSASVAVKDCKCRIGHLNIRVFHNAMVVQPPNPEPLSDQETYILQNMAIAYFKGYFRESWSCFWDCLDDTFFDCD